MLRISYLYLPNLVRAPAGRRSYFATSILVLVMLVACRAQAANTALDPHPADMLRLGFSATMFNGLNESDARASIKALAATIAREEGIQADPDPVITPNLEKTAEAVRTGLVDAISITMEEYYHLRTQASFDRFLVATYVNDPTETYLLLVHKQSSLLTLADLQGKKLSVLTGARMSLALPWIDVELARAGLPASFDHVGTLAETVKAPKAILPVFFQQTDACLVTQRAYNTVVELNPQIGRDLRVLAASPRYIPALFGFRTACSSRLKEKSISVFTLLHQTLYGQQTLLIFQSNQVVECPASAFTEALALLDEYARSCPAQYQLRLAALRVPSKRDPIAR